MRTRSAEREAEAAPHPAAAKPHRKKPLTVWRALTGNDPRVIFPVYAAWLIVLSWMCDLPIWQRLLAFYIGVLYETWLEFSVHRWVLHYPLFVPKSLSDWLGKDFFYMVHGHHHVHPDRPPYFPLPHSQVMAFVSYGMFRLLLPAPWACGIGAGGMGGLILFENVHAWIHRGISAPLFKPMETYHHHHHGKSKRCAYTFTTPFWDWLFGTLPMPGVFEWPVVPLPLPVAPFVVMALLGRKDKAQ